MEETGLDLKRLCPTRWSSRIDSVSTVKTKHRAIIRCLTKLEFSRVKGVGSTSKGLLNRVKSFEFTMTLLFWEKILTKTQAVSNLLQTKNIDLSALTTALDSLNKHLTRLEENWDSLITEGVQQAKFAGGEEDFTLSMSRNLYCYYGKSRVDLDAPSKEKLYRANIFLPCLRECKKQVQLRFDGHNQTVQLFKCLSPRFLAELSVQKIEKAAGDLRERYCSDLGVDFVSQLTDLSSDYRQEILGMTSQRQILDFILKSDLGLLYPEVVTGLYLFVTLPVSVASAERTFSKLKLIKNYLRSTMKQQRLTALAMISIELETAQALDRSDLVKKFAGMKVRRGQRFNLK